MIVFDSPSYVHDRDVRQRLLSRPRLIDRNSHFPYTQSYGISYHQPILCGLAV
jgi:hypothetical protein